VLVVDAAAAIRSIVAELLEDKDYVVDTAGGRNDGIGGGVVS
jgi:CheY-like chemotaxis protein